MLPVVRGILSGLHVDVEGVELDMPMKVACNEYFAGNTVPAGAVFADKSVYVTYLTGTMTKHGTCFNYGTREIANELLEADADPDVVGHIIVADSGGGAADSVPELADAIRQLSKPVVGFVDGMAASACLYALSYTRRIIAHQPTDQVGCVGTMITVSGWPKVRRDADGYVEVRIYADQSAEKNADYEAALEGNTQIIKEEVLNPLCARFISDMKANRPAATDDQLKGRTYFASDVCGTLIDSIGNFASAVQAVIELAAESQENESIPTGMTRYPQLESIPELAEQVYEQDGSTVLQECQLEAIEQALTAHRPEEVTALQAQVETLTSAHREEMEAARQAIAERDATVAEQASRISELERALEEADARNREEIPAAVKVDADPSNTVKGAAPAKTHAEAVAACREFLAKQTN